MPLSEFYRMARGKLESGQQKTTTCLTDLSHVPDNEFVELVWENGQIMMQGQSSRARRSLTSSNFQNQTPEPRDKDPGHTTNSKMGKFGVMDSVLNEFPSMVPSGEMGFGQDDDMVPWLNYPIDDSPQQGYCSELLPELSGVTVNEPSAQNSFSLIGKRNSCNQTIRGSHSISAHNCLSLDQANASKVSSSENGEPSRSRGSQFHLWSSQESQTLTPSHRSGVSSIISNTNSSTKRAICVDSIQDQASAGGFPSRKIQKQDSGLPHTNPGFMNFSHFSRPAALVRANLQHAGAMGTPGASSGIEVMQGKNKGTDPSNSNPAESAPIDLSSGLMKEMGSKNQPNLLPSKVDSEPVVAKPLEVSRAAEQSESVCQEDAVKNNKLPDEAGASTLKGMPDGEKTLEPAVASSSVCSGNGAERASNDPMHNLKRKCYDVDDSEGRSEDIEEESVGVRKAASARGGGGGGAGSKRSRAAEVHNLSERRRRDRINEKMRALQELIPNCNKVDKASMLDEAIEYLKTLQLQVQIMSMGAGLYMPPMMLPTGLQHVHAAHMAHFSPMAVGMGMGMGYGMGMLDMNGGSTGCPMIQVPPMQGAHFPAPRPSPVSGSTSFQEMAGSNPQVFGHPSQGFPMSAPRPHLVPLSVGLPSAVGLNVNGMTAVVKVPNSAPSSTSDKLRHNANPQITDNTDSSSFVNQKSSQCQATNEGFEQAPLVHKTDQAPDVGSGDNLNFSEENDTSPSRPACCD